jgi:hypothetical protein
LFILYDASTISKTYMPAVNQPLSPQVKTKRKIKLPLQTRRAAPPGPLVWTNQMRNDFTYFERLGLLVLHCCCCTLVSGANAAHHVRTPATAWLLLLLHSLSGANAAHNVRSASDGVVIS